MSAKNMLVPDIGDFEDVDVIEVHISPGQQLDVDDPVVTLENDKASMDLPATEAGVVKEVKIKVGDKVSEGSVIYTLEPSGAAPTAVPPAEEKPAPKPAPAPAAPAPKPAAPEAPPAASVSLLAPPASASSFARVHASPSIRRFARSKGVDLNKIQGTGRKGRITREDVEIFLDQRNAKPSKKKSSTPAYTPGIPPIPAVDFSKFGSVETMEFSRIKRLTAKAMTRSWLNIPHVTHNDEADITELEAFRQSIKQEAKDQGYRVSLLAFAMKALVSTLKAFPTFNASLDPSGEGLILKNYYHIGIAVDTPNGLVVPVIRDVDKKSVYQLAEDLSNISQKARKNKLALSDIQGATITISSLGGIGGTTFTPIINAPEVAILGLTRSKMQPIWDGKEFKPRLMQPMSLSYDHRAIDGAEAARFCRHFATMLGDIRRVLL